MAKIHVHLASINSYRYSLHWTQVKCTLTYLSDAYAHYANNHTFVHLERPLWTIAGARDVMSHDRCNVERSWKGFWVLKHSVCHHWKFSPLFSTFEIKLLYYKHDYVYIFADVCHQDLLKMIPYDVRTKWDSIDFKDYPIIQKITSFGNLSMKFVFLQLVYKIRGRRLWQNFTSYRARNLMKWN